MSHKFGNIDHWTKDKLAKVKEYLDAYLLALKKQPFSLEYIDAFAGTGYVNRSVTIPSQSLFDSDETVSMKDFIDGSARLALQTDPPFEKYTFIEMHKNRFNELSKLQAEFPKLSDRISVVNSEANEYVKQLCSSDWLGSNRRGVMFLDPYGTQLEWQTLKAIANTRAIDAWILFPMGTVNRLLNRNGKIIEGRRKKLNELFGQENWFERFYQNRHDKLPFVDPNDRRFLKLASFDVIADYFVERLKTCFSAVAPNPLIL